MDKIFFEEIPVLETREETAYLGLGSNLGDREGYISQAVEKICKLPGIEVKELSPLYETKPFGLADQPDFLNAVLPIKDTQSLGEMSASTLLLALQRIERELGRERKQRNGPRTIDLDILDYGGLQMEGEFQFSLFYVRDDSVLKKDPLSAKEGDDYWFNRGRATLNLPHPGLDRRSSVLYPLRDVAQDYVHPVSGKSIDEMISELSGEENVNWRIYDGV